MTMTFQETVQAGYQKISNGLTEAIQQEIRHHDPEAIANYGALIDQANQELRAINNKYDTTRLSPIEKVSLNNLMSLKAKIVARKAGVESRLNKKESLLITGNTHTNASSYSSFMSAFIPANQSPPVPEPPVLPPRKTQEFKVPTIAPPTQRQVNSSTTRSTSNPNPKPTRSSLDLPRPGRINKSSEARSKSPTVRKERPKSVDLTISQAATLAWDQNPRKVTPPSRSNSPIRQNGKRSSMYASKPQTLQRRYDYVQPSINTQINLTPVNKTKSPPLTPLQTTSSKKKVAIPATGPSPQQLQKPEKDVAKEYDDPRIAEAMNNLQGTDKGACEQILDEILVKGESLTWDDIAGLDTAKQSLKETVVYPFLRPDLFRGLREPVTGMLLFGPPGTGKTMIAKTVANEAGSTFFSISASSLLSKYLGESEKLIRALFFMARKLSPSIIFFDEIDSLLSARSDGEHESSRRVKTEFLIQWSALSSATAKDESENSRVLVLAATNLPWAIDEAARRRFTRRLYIPLPEFETRLTQLKKLMKYQKHGISDMDFVIIANLTEGYSNSDITSLAKEAAMEPIRDLGESLMSIENQHIRGVVLQDFEKAMKIIRKSVAKETLGRFQDWAANFGSTGA